MAREARQQCDKLVMLPGNHEGFMLDTLSRDQSRNASDLVFWTRVGGSAVLDEVGAPMDASPEGICDLVRARLPEGYLDDLARARGHYKCGDLLFVHAGILPPLGADHAQKRAEFLAQPLGDAPKRHWATICRPFLEWNGGWDEDRREIVVHGHTILNNSPIRSTTDLEVVSDMVASQNRIGLDIGAVHFDNLAILEARENQYRLWLLKFERYLP